MAPRFSKVKPLAYLAAAAALAASIPAAAQSAIPSAASISALPTPIDLIPKVRLKAGIFVPEDTSIRNNVGEVWFKVGAEANIPFGPGIGSGRISVEYAGSGSAHEIPVLAGAVIRPSALFFRSPIYVGAALGGYHLKAAQGEGWAFGGRIMGGVDFTQRFFGELQYDFTTQVHGVHGAGLSVLAGVKF